jgi:hypothetical protein
MPVALMMVNLVVRTPESNVSFGFFEFLSLFGFIFAIFHMYTNDFSV